MILRSVSRATPDRGHHGSPARQTGKPRQTGKIKKDTAPSGVTLEVCAVYGLIYDSMEGGRTDRVTDRVHFDFHKLNPSTVFGWW